MTSIEGAEQMTDIVERLRACIEDDASLAEEAADEIERLRAELTEARVPVVSSEAERLEEWKQRCVDAHDSHSVTIEQLREAQAEIERLRTRAANAESTILDLRHEMERLRAETNILRIETYRLRDSWASFTTQFPELAAKFAK